MLGSVQSRIVAAMSFLLALVLALAIIAVRTISAFDRLVDLGYETATKAIEQWRNSGLAPAY